MMGRTHALGGAAALAGYSIATNQADVVPLWAYGVAFVSALVPDLDNPHASLLSRRHFFPIKWGTYPLWVRAAHRGMTHSVFGVAMYAAIIAAWWWIIGFAFAAAGAPWAIPIEFLLPAALIGYTSHIVLDMLNIPGVELLWPLPFRFYFPPWRAKGFIPGRFNADSNWSHMVVHLPLTMFMGWFFIEHLGAVLQATTSDETFSGLLKAFGRLISNLANLVLGNDAPAALLLLLWP